MLLLIKFSDTLLNNQNNLYKNNLNIIFKYLEFIKFYVQCTKYRKYIFIFTIYYYYLYINLNCNISYKKIFSNNIIFYMYIFL